MHVALGSGFAELGGKNDSGLHWDMICDLRADGEVYADGELIWRAGSFLEQAASRHVSDSRHTRLADVLVGYSTRVQPGDLVLIEAAALAGAADPRGLPQRAPRGRPPASRAWRSTRYAEKLLRDGHRRAARLGQPGRAWTTSSWPTSGS